MVRISDIYWLLAKTTCHLSNISNRNVVQRPKRIFIECYRSLFNSYFYTVGKQVILPNEITLLDTSEQFRVFCL